MKTPSDSSKDSSKKYNSPLMGFHVLLPADDITSLASIGDIIYAGGRDGVYSIDRKSRKIIDKIDFGREVDYVKALAVDKNGSLLVGYDGGLLFYKNKKTSYFGIKDGLSDTRINAIKIAKDGRILIGSWGGLSIYDGTTWKNIKESDGLGSNMVNVILEDYQGTVFLGSYLSPTGALSIYTNKKWQYFTTKNGLPNNNITSIYEESPGRVWVGTGFYDKGGTICLVEKEGSWSIEQTLVKWDGLAGYKVRSIFKDSLANLWFGSEYDGGALFRNGKSVVITKKTGLSDNEIKCIFQDADKNIWLGTHRGVTVIDYETLKKLH